MQCFIHFITLYNVTFLIYLFYYSFFCPITCNVSYLITVYLCSVTFFMQARISFYFDIDTSDKDYEMSMVSEIVISLRPYLKQT